MRGVRRKRGVAQRQAEPPMLDDFFNVLARIGDRAKHLRDKVLLLIGFAGRFRRSKITRAQAGEPAFPSVERSGVR